MTLEKVLLLLGILNIATFVATCAVGSNPFFGSSKLSELNILQIILLPFFGVGAFLHFLLFNKLKTFFTTKPFKRTKFKVGEKVYFQGKIVTVIANEKTIEGNQVKIQADGYLYPKIVDSTDLKKVSKLEKALK